MTQGLPWGTILVDYFTKDINPSLAKPPPNFNDSLAKVWLTTLVR